MIQKIQSQNFKQELNKTKYEFVLLPELQIQEELGKYLKHGKKPPLLPKPFDSSTPLKTEKIKKKHDDEKESYFRTAITINGIDLDAAVKNAEESNKEVISEITDPTPVLTVDDIINLDKQFEFTSNHLERNFELSNRLQERLDNLLIKMKENTKSFS